MSRTIARLRAAAFPAYNQIKDFALFEEAQQ